MPTFSSYLTPNSSTAIFFCFAKSQIAREVQKVLGWTGGLFERGTRPVIVTHEPEAQENRLRYLLSQGVKEGLVPHPSKWPGVHSAKALLTGKMKHHGIWIRGTEKYEVTRTRRRLERRRRVRLRKGIDPSQFADKVTLELSPIPCWDGLTKSEIALRARELCAQVVEEHSDAIARVPSDYRKRVTDRRLRCFRPRRTKREEQPAVHAASLEVWREYVAAQTRWIAQFRAASARLRQGILVAIYEFPENAFVPSGLASRVLRGVRPP